MKSIEEKYLSKLDNNNLSSIDLESSNIISMYLYSKFNKKKTIKCLKNRIKELKKLIKEIIKNLTILDKCPLINEVDDE